jgi:hypothetical protein
MIQPSNGVVAIFHPFFPWDFQSRDIIANQPDTLQKMTISLLVNVDIPINTKRLVRISVYPSKIDLEIIGTS